MQHYENVVEGGQLVISPGNIPGRFRVSATSDLAKRVITYGDFEPELTSLLENFSDLDGDIVNIGANVGFYAVFFARNFRNARKVIAIEPNPEAFEELKLNIALNEVDAIVEPLQACIGENHGQMEFSFIPGKSEYSSIGSVSHHAVSGLQQETVAIDVMPLGKAAAGHLSDPKMIFIDTEGAELLVLKGAEDILRNAMPILIFECEDALLAEFGHSSKQLVSYVTSLGYEVRNAADTTRKIRHPFAGVAIAIAASDTEYSRMFRTSRH
jgi:FkbM family methyltransferase